MENALVGSKKFVLGVKIHCKGCETKVKKRLISIQGVHTVAIDSKKGRITITGTIHPPTLISILETYSIKAILLWEETPPPKEGSLSSVNGDNNSDDQHMVQLITGSKIIYPFEDLEMVRTIQQLSGGKETEVTISRTVKVVFNDGKMKVVETTNSVTTGKNEKVVMNNNSSSIPTREEKTVMGTPYLVSGGAHNIEGHHHCWCQYPGHMRNHNDQHWAAPPGPWESSGSGTAPFSPPIRYDYSPVRPAPGHPPYQNVFSDDNVNGCVIV